MNHEKKHHHKEKEQPKES